MIFYFWTCEVGTSPTAQNHTIAFTLALLLSFFSESMFHSAWRPVFLKCKLDHVTPWLRVTPVASHLFYVQSAGGLLDLPWSGPCLLVQLPLLTLLPSFMTPVTQTCSGIPIDQDFSCAGPLHTWDYPWNALYPLFMSSFSSHHRWLPLTKVFHDCFHFNYPSAPPPPVFLLTSSIYFLSGT